MIIKIKRLYRSLIGTCISCGRKPEHHVNCFHCSVNSKYCHQCGKTYNFARAYGIGYAK